jgi:hypothetical protein
VNSYMIAYVYGPPTEIEADVYQAEGEDWVFLEGSTEILRVKATEVSSITKAR